jgi:hypothetical protein
MIYFGIVILIVAVVIFVVAGFALKSGSTSDDDSSADFGDAEPGRYDHLPADYVLDQMDSDPCGGWYDESDRDEQLARLGPADFDASVDSDSSVSSAPNDWVNG